jgi:hypothetical protein
LAAIIIAAVLAYSCDDDGTSGPASPESHWETAFGTSPVPEAVADFWFCAPGDGWATMGDKVLRYEGGEWREFHDFNTDPSIGDIYCEAICALAPDDVWVGGSLKIGYPQTNLVHYDGEEWTPYLIPYEGLWPPIMRDLFFLGPDAGWLACSQGIYYYDGATWTLQFENPARSLTMLSANDGWALASVEGRADVIHWDGSSWTPQGIGGEYESGDRVQILEEINFRAPDDGWVIGFRGPYFRGHVLRYDGTSWSEVALPEGTPSLEAGAFDGADSGWLVSDEENVGVKAWRLHDGAVSAAPLPENTWYVKAVATPAPGEAWAIAFPNPNLYSNDSYVLRYTGAE